VGGSQANQTFPGERKAAASAIFIFTLFVHSVMDMFFLSLLSIHPSNNTVTAELVRKHRNKWETIKVKTGRKLVPLETQTWSDKKLQACPQLNTQRPRTQHIPRTKHQIENLTLGETTPEGEEWIRKHRNNKEQTAVICSDGSVYDCKHQGGYAWKMYERQEDGTLRTIGVMGVGVDKCSGLQAHSVHSYRVESIAVLSGLRFLRNAGWQGKVEWHTDSKGTISTYAKVQWNGPSKWYAQRDKDVWEQLMFEMKYYNNKVNLLHVKAHTDTKKGHISTPEQLANQEMDVLAKAACRSSTPPITGMDLTHKWHTRMHSHRVLGHQKTYILNQILYDRSVQQLEELRHETGGQKDSSTLAHQNEIYAHLTQTAPLGKDARYESLQVWRKLPTNDIMTTWNYRSTPQCMCCLHPTESNHHLMHECVHEGIVKVRHLIHAQIVELICSAGGSPLLQSLIAQLFEVMEDGRTMIYTPANIPAAWMKDFDDCPDHGHKYVSTMLKGLAAETILQTGNSNLLWRGILPHSMIKMMHMGDIPFDQIRKLTRQIRTALHHGSKMIWKHRNIMNFAEQIEAERLAHHNTITGVRAHIASNDKAQQAGLTVEEVVDMEPADREQWIASTKDHIIKQTGIHEIFPRIETTQKLISPEELPTLQELIVRNRIIRSSKRQPKLSLPSTGQRHQAPVPGRLSTTEYKQLLKTQALKVKKGNIQYQREVQKHSAQSTWTVVPAQKRRRVQPKRSSAITKATTGNKTGKKRTRETSNQPDEPWPGWRPGHTSAGGGSGLPQTNQYQCLANEADETYEEYIHDLEQDTSSDSSSDDQHNVSYSDNDEDFEPQDKHVPPTGKRKYQTRRKRRQNKAQRHTRKTKRIEILSDSDSESSEETMSSVVAWAEKQNADLSDDSSEETMSEVVAWAKKQNDDYSDDEKEDLRKRTRNNKRNIAETTPLHNQQQHAQAPPTIPAPPNTTIPIDRLCIPWMKKRKKSPEGT
jgi:hypothetical protein